jgi:hypothetical protein
VALSCLEYVGEPALPYLNSSMDMIAGADYWKIKVSIFSNGSQGPPLGNTNIPAANRWFTN